MLIDAHSHILSLAADPEFTAAYGREGSLCIFRSMGVLPSHRMPTEGEWEASGYSGRGWPLIGPAASLRDHPGFDKIVVLAVSPQYLESFGTDYPGSLYDPVALAEKVRSVNDEATAVSLDPIPRHKLDGLLGGNFGRFLGLIQD